MGYIKGRLVPSEGNSPLVLDALDLIIHAEHDMAHGLIIVIVIFLVICRVVEIRVYGITINIVVVVRSVNLAG